MKDKNEKLTLSVPCQCRSIHAGVAADGHFSLEGYRHPISIEPPCKELYSCLAAPEPRGQPDCKEPLQVNNHGG